MGFAARPHDKDLTTLAAVRNGLLTRVGSIASVVAIASRYSIQTVLIHRVHHVRQWVAKIFLQNMLAKYPNATPSRRRITSFDTHAAMVARVAWTTE